MTFVYPFFNPSSRWYYPLRWLVLILLGLAIYAQTFGYNFVFDDLNFIARNPYIRSFGHVHSILRICPSTRLLGFYSFAFNYHIHQLHPQGYHIFNFIIHLVSVGLIWATAGVIFKIAGWLPSEDKLRQEIPFIMAVLFLVHPCQTQAVTYISQRFESMAAMFYIGSIYSYLCGRISSSRAQKTFLFTCSMGLAILGLFTKEVAATIPLMILAAELIFFKGNRRKICIVLTVGGILFFIFFMKLVRTDLNIFFHFQPVVSQSHDGDIITAKSYLLTQMRVFLTFIRILVFPIHQNLDYDYPLSSGILSPPSTLMGMCLMGLMVFSIFKLRRKFPVIAFGMAWILITFSINLAPRANVIFEHKLYLISFGYFLILVSTLFIFIRQRTLLLKLLVLMIATLSILSFLRNQVWKNEITLWEDVVKKSPYKARSYNGLGVAWEEQGSIIAALSNYQKALAINPDYANAFNGLGNVYSRQHDFARALVNYNKAIATNPADAEIYINRGICYAKEGDFALAMMDFKKALVLKPNDDFARVVSNFAKTLEESPHKVRPFINLGSAYYQEGDYAQALSNFNKAIEINPGCAEAYYGRGNVYTQQGDITQALSNYDKAIGINPGYVDAYYNRGNAYAKQGKFTQAVSDYHKAIEIKPESPEIYNSLGNAYAQEGNSAQALFNYNKAIEISPNYADAYYNRGIFLGQNSHVDQAILDFNKAIDIHPDDGDFYYNRGFAYYQLKNYNLAWQDVHKAKELGIDVDPVLMSTLKEALSRSK